MRSAGLSVGVAVLLALAAPVAPAAADGNAAAGHGKAKKCAACHGIDGKAKLPDAPNLAGQNPIYLVAALNAYKSGARKNDMMSLVAPKLSDQDIADLAAYYASLGAAPK
jgi:cytochrome c553